MMEDSTIQISCPFSEAVNTSCLLWVPQGDKRGFRALCFPGNGNLFLNGSKLQTKEKSLLYWIQLFAVEIKPQTTIKEGVIWMDFSLIQSKNRGCIYKCSIILRRLMRHPERSLLLKFKKRMLMLVMVMTTMVGTTGSPIPCVSFILFQSWENKKWHDRL